MPNTNTSDLPAPLAGASCNFLSGHSSLRSGSCQTHSHAFFEIVYHPSGRGTTCVNGEHTIYFQEGSAVVYAPYTRHDQVMSEPGVDVVVSMELTPYVPGSLPQWWYAGEILDPFLLQEFRLLADAPPSRTKIQQEILNHRALAVLLTLFCADRLGRVREKSPSLYCAERALHYLRHNYQTIKYMDEVATSLGISPSYLRDIYRQRFGTSLIASLGRLRIERAQELLRNTSLTLSAIAADCGFANERYLSTVFKKLIGCTPGQFRRQLPPEES